MPARKPSPSSIAYDERMREEARQRRIARGEDSETGLHPSNTRAERYKRYAALWGHTKAVEMIMSTEYRFGVAGEYNIFGEKFIDLASPTDHAAIERQLRIEAWTGRTRIDLASLPPQERADLEAHMVALRWFSRIVLGTVALIWILVLCGAKVHGPL